MKIRRYIGSNTQEAILKVKMDLGNEAVILNTRKVRKKGLFKIFSKPMVEVLAAIDDDYGVKKNKEQQKNIPKPQQVERPRQELEEGLELATSDKEKKITELENKVCNMESLLQKVYDQLQPGGQKNVDEEKAEIKSKETSVLQLFINNLIKNEVDIEITNRITQLVKQKLGDNSSVNDTASVIYNLIASILGKPETVRLREDGKATVAIFVGPTGVGKTTTLAKIAANFALNLKKNVGLITADTYRIAAVEQLKTYAEILGIPVSVVYSPTEIKEAINQYSDKDIILIDTAGRSHRNKTQFEELKSLVFASEADEFYLVLSSTTSTRSCKDILDQYNFLKNFKLIFTKLDETSTSGLILNLKFLTNKSLSYVTTGQSVPDDIEVANIDKITKNLLGSIT
jgi:flagellar biosynthesis protein FlhF